MTYIQQSRNSIPVDMSSDWTVICSSWALWNVCSFPILKIKKNEQNKTNKQKMLGMSVNNNRIVCIALTKLPQSRLTIFITILVFFSFLIDVCQICDAHSVFDLFSLSTVYSLITKNKKTSPMLFSIFFVSSPFFHCFILMFFFSLFHLYPHFLCVTTCNLYQNTWIAATTTKNQNKKPLSKTILCCWSLKFEKKKTIFCLVPCSRNWYRYLNCLKIKLNRSNRINSKSNNHNSMRCSVTNRSMFRYWAIRLK